MMDQKEDEQNVIDEFHRVEALLVKKCHYLESKITKEKDCARSRSRENKRDEALRCMRRMKQYERMLHQQQRAAESLQSLCLTLEQVIGSHPEQFLHAMYTARAAALELASKSEPPAERPRSPEHCCIPHPEPDADSMVSAEDSGLSSLAKEILSNVLAHNDKVTADHLQRSTFDEDILNELRCLEELPEFPMPSSEDPVSTAAGDQNLEDQGERDACGDTIDSEIRGLEAWANS